MIAIVNYGLGNLRSVAGAVERLGYQAKITGDPCDFAKANKLILPGVGAFGDGMLNIRTANLDLALDKEVLEKKKPILGICLGFQLMAQTSEEFGNHKGLGWISADVVRLKAEGLPLPHVGWNDLSFTDVPTPLWENVNQDALFYYVHTYRLKCHDKSIIVGECEYGERFPAAISMGNIHGTQFHPEKSQQWGLVVLQNFLKNA